MHKYSLYLKENGDGFEGIVMLNGEARYFTNITNKNNHIFLDNYPSLNFTFPECIKAALHCKNRKDVASFIKKYLISYQTSSDPDYYAIKDSDEPPILINLRHQDFYDVNEGYKGHSRLVQRNHSETPQEMLNFVYNRSSFFMENYKKVQEYKNTSWLNPNWILICIDYYLKALINSLARAYYESLDAIKIGGEYNIVIPYTHYCEDFYQGCKATQEDIINEEAVAQMGFCL